MNMTAEEICREYRQAKDKDAQIGILADLNQCSKEKILEILKTGGALKPVHSDGLVERCKRVLEERGLSQSKFCRKYGLSQSTLSTYIRGESKSTPAMEERIAAALDKLESSQEPTKRQPKTAPVLKPQEGVLLTRDEAEVLLGLLTDVLPEYIEGKVANMDLLEIHGLTGVYKKLL